MCNFASLPEEVLCMVFDLLDLEDVKSASLTCRRWHNIIFLGPYIKRFQYEIDLYYEFHRPIQVYMEPTFKIKKLMGAVNRSKRCYRNLRLDITKYRPGKFQSLWKSLHPKVTENIYSLRLTLYEVEEKISNLIFDTIPLMPKLRSLSVFIYNSIDLVTVLRSSSVQHLRLNESENNIKIDMPELESFDGPLDAFIPPDGINPPSEFAKLKYAEVTYISDECTNHFKIIPVRFRNVETLILNDQVEETLFNEICDTCTKLKELDFKYHLKIDDAATIKHLSKLSNLRRLKFRFITNAPISHNNYVFPFDFDLSELKQLEDLDLGFIVFDAERLIHLPKSLTHLSVSLSYENEENIIQSITGSLTQLQNLCLVYGANDEWIDPNHFALAKNTLKSLNHLKQLKELVFANAELCSETEFLDMEDLMHRLRVLRFVNCILDHNRLQELEQIFPNLEIEISDARPIIPISPCPSQLDHERQEQYNLS